MAGLKGVSSGPTVGGLTRGRAHDTGLQTGHPHPSYPMLSRKRHGPSQPPAGASFLQRDDESSRRPAGPRSSWTDLPRRRRGRPAGPLSALAYLPRHPRRLASSILAPAGASLLQRDDESSRRPVGPRSALSYLSRRLHYVASSIPDPAGLRVFSPAMNGRVRPAGPRSASAYLPRRRPGAAVPPHPRCPTSLVVAIA